MSCRSSGSRIRRARIDSEQLAQAVKTLAKERGAALVGVAPVERFDPMPPVGDAAPREQHPRDFIPGARSVISFAMPILPAVLEAPALLAESDLEMIPAETRRHYLDMVYNRVGHVVHDCQLEFIGQMIGQFLLMQGYDAMIFATTGVHPRIGNKTKAQIWADAPFGYSSGPFSHRHAATRAGLGEFGYSNVVLTKEFGPRQRFNSVVTDAELVYVADRSGKRFPDSRRLPAHLSDSEEARSPAGTTAGDTKPRTGQDSGQA